MQVCCSQHYYAIVQFIQIRFETVIVKTVFVVVDEHLFALI